MSGMQKGVNASTTKMTASITALKSAMASLGIVFGAFAIVNFGKNCLRAASDLQEVQNVVDVTFGDMSGSVDSFAKTAIESFGLSEYAAKKYASTMGAMLKSSGIAGDQVADLSINITELAADMASFYNLSSEEAFGKIQSGLAGTVRPLRDLGINMTVANLEAFAMSQGVTKSYDAMTQAEQVMLRYNYLLSTTTDAQGDFARTSNSWANQVKILSMRFEELKTQLGQGLINALTPAIRLLNSIVAALTRVATYWNALTAAIFGKQTAVASYASDSAESAAESENEYADSIKAAGKAAKGNLAAFDNLNVLQKNTGDGAGVASGITGLSFSIPQGFIDFAEKIKQVVKENVNLDRLSAAFGRLRDAVAKFKDSPLGKFLADLAQSVVLVFFEKLAQAVQIVVDVFATAIDIVSWFATLLSGDIAAADELAKQVFEDIGNVIENVFVLILGQDAVNAIKDFAKALPENARLAWEKVKEIWGVVKTWFSENVIQPVKIFFTGLWNGIKTGATTAWNGIKGVFLTVATWISDHIIHPISDGFRGFINGLLGFVESFVNFFIRGINAIIGAINKLSVTVPDWVPLIGGKKFGFNIPSVTELSLPRLETGGIVDSSTMAEIGENGREAVLPLENNTGWMDALAERIGGNIVINATGEAGLLRYLNMSLDKDSARRGKNLIVGGAY